MFKSHIYTYIQWLTRVFNLKLYNLQKFSRCSYALFTYLRDKFLNLKTHETLSAHEFQNSYQFNKCSSLLKNIKVDKRANYAVSSHYPRIYPWRAIFTTCEKAKKRREKFPFLSHRLSREKKKKKKKKEKHSCVALLVETYAARPTRPCSSPCYQLCALRRNLRS